MIIHEVPNKDTDMLIAFTVLFSTKVHYMGRAENRKLNLLRHLVQFCWTFLDNHILFMHHPMILHSLRTSLIPLAVTYTSKFSDGTTSTGLRSLKTVNPIVQIVKLI